MMKRKNSVMMMNIGDQNIIMKKSGDQIPKIKSEIFIMAEIRISTSTEEAPEISSTPIQIIKGNKAIDLNIKITLKGKGIST